MERARTLRLALLVFLYFLFAAFGVVSALPEKQSTSTPLFSVLMALTVTGLCLTDARIVGKRLVHAAQWVTFFTWPISAPIYLGWSRGARGLLLAMLHAVLLFMTAAAGRLAIWMYLLV